MKRRELYLEERIGLVYRALNEQSAQFGNRLAVVHSDREAARFRRYVLEMLGVLVGDKSHASSLRRRLRR